MTFRIRLFTMMSLTLVAALAIIGLGMRREMRSRLTGQYQVRLQERAQLVGSAFAALGEQTAHRVTALVATVRRDPRFRAGVDGLSQQDQRYLADFPDRARALSGLDLLLVADSAGDVLSGSIGPGDTTDRLSPGLSQALSNAGKAGLLPVPDDSSTRALQVVADTVRFGARLTALLGGVAIDSALLQRLAGPEASLRLVSGRVGGDSIGHFTREIPLTWFGPDSLSPDARPALELALSRGPLDSFIAALDRWFIGLGGLTLAGVLLVSLLVARGLSAPLSRLSQDASEISLGRGMVTAGLERSDEIGQLAETLDRLVSRLRATAAERAEAERRAVVGDLARQLNHDIKNGLVPLRNVMNHLVEASEAEPASVAGILGERRGTILKSIEYLENLARSVATLSSPLSLQPCSVNAILEDVGRGRPGLQFGLAAEQPTAMADEIALRRVFDNLISNALDSIDPRGGSVVVRSAAVPGEGGSRIRVTISDNGRGMGPDQLERAFTEFYTTKPGGSGLGLAIVRRLVLDLGGSLKVETAPGEGTRVLIELPAAS